MFGILYTYKVAIFPFPAVFISASSEVPALLLEEVQKNIEKEKATSDEKIQIEEFKIGQYRRKRG